MSAKKSSKKTGVNVVRFEGAEVSVFRKGDGNWGLKWREDGRWKATSRADEKMAVGFAERKARELAGKTGRQWIKPGDAEALECLRRLALDAEMNVGELVAEVSRAAERLKSSGGILRLRAAADYYVTNGPGGVVDIRLHEALDLVRKEYDFAKAATKNTMYVAIDAMKRLMEDKLLAEVKREDVERFAFEDGKSKRTVRNRISQAGTFFARCKALEMWPEARPLPNAAIKKPRLPDVAPQIFTPDQGKRLYLAVRKKFPRYLRYMVLAGWLGCRPSECLRLRWDGFDFEHDILHLSHEVVGKTGRERWVPLDARVKAVMLEMRKQAIEEGRGEVHHKVCLTHSREEISKLARSMGMGWPDDVLRHSAITYTLQLLGNNYNKTAEIMGNSPAVIESNYRRPIPAGRGEMWMEVLL